MSRLTAPLVAEAPAASQPLFELVRKAIGRIPNVYALIGGLSPAAMKVTLEGDAALSHGTLPKADIEAIRIAISAQNGCDYCVAAHSAVGKMLGMKSDELHHLRSAESVDDPKRAALVDFARYVASSSGTVPAERVQAVLAAGWSQPQLIEALLVVALIGFTNLVNRVNDTAVDFPAPT